MQDSPHKGHLQRRPTIPYLFLMYAEGFTTLLKKVKEKSQYSRGSDL